jgi:eukaryotic-like serine/threonine-protein kinase
MTIERLRASLADRYRIERELGAGGMATVYLAEDLKHHRKVAIKVLKPELAAVLGADRFVQEITTTAALQHPHILPLFDSGSADGFLYYVMPYVEGETLRTKLDREHQLGIDEAVRITTEVADALDYAHRHGVIHRDIKPENILLHDGRPMVADFGIALAVSAAAGGRMTETGLSLGTPHYMSPEQATAEKEITARSDIYSLGSVLYEMLAGAPPHHGGSAQQIIMKIIAEDAQPVTTLRKSVPPNVAAAVGKSLEKLPADRFDSAQAFRSALLDPHFTIAGVAAAAAAVHTGPPSRRLTVALGAALAVMTAVAAWALLRPAPLRPVIRYGLALPADQEPVSGGFAVITSDGSRIAYAGPGTRPGQWQLWIKPRDGLMARPLAGTAGVTAAAISPDDEWIAFVVGGILRKVPLAGGATVDLFQGAASVQGSVAWLDDGTIVFINSVVGTRSIRRIPADGGAPENVWTSDSLLPTALAPLPGSRGVLFAACTAPCDRPQLWALDLASHDVHQIAADGVAAWYLSTGHLAFVRRDYHLLVVPFDLGSLRVRGTPVAVLDSVSGDGPFPYFAVSQSGTAVMQLGATPQALGYTLVWVDRAGRVTPVDSSWTFRVTQFAGNFGWALSPDGTRLAIGLNTAEGDDIWVKPLPRGPATRVTFGVGPEHRPRWTSDGRTLTFVTDNGLVLRRADGTGRDSLLVRGQLDEGLVSPDGRWVVLRRGATSAASGGRDIFGLRLGVDTAPVPLLATPYDEMAMVLSPDGRWMAYQSDETGRLEVFIRPFPNTSDQKVQVSSTGGTGPVWARNGHVLFYLRDDRTMMAVPVTAGTTLQLGEPRELFRLPEQLSYLSANYYSPWDVGPDGRFVMARSTDTGAGTGRPLVVVENWLGEVKAKVHR